MDETKSIGDNTKVTLEPTAALVMDLARNYYLEDDLTSKYLQYLDVSSAQTMIDAHKSSGIYELTQELICNRKFIVRHAIIDSIQSNRNKTQVVILAAGKSPLSLELLHREYGRIEQVYEVDVSSFAEKGSIYDDLASNLCQKVSFVQGDIRAVSLPEDLSGAGFIPDLPTVIVLEGITHYMTANDLLNILKSFVSSSHRDNTVILDFGPTYDSLTSEIQPIARRAYGIIEEFCYRQEMTKYSLDQLAEIIDTAGGELTSHYTIHDAEKLRTDSNKFFPEKNSGWLEYVVAKI